MERVQRKLILEGESGCGKTTLLRNTLGADAEKAGGFITARISEQEIVKGFVLAPVSMLRQSLIQTEDVMRKKLPCFLSLHEEMKQETQVFTVYAAAYLKQAVQHPFAVLDEIGGVELLEDAFYKELLSFFQADLPWICVLKSERSAEAMGRRITLGKLYWKRYRHIREFLTADEGVQHIYMTGFTDRNAGEILEKWKKQECG